MEFNYDRAYKYLEKYAREHNVKYFEIVEDNYEYENGLLLIAYYDEECEYEDFHVCIDVSEM